MNGQERIDERRRRQAGRRGFTLIELLVVMLIILLVSAVVLPTVLPAISHRQVSEAARILQGALAGARDTAINNNAPAGIRLLPDPVLNGQSLNAPGTTVSRQLDPTRILASNRYIPIQLAPDYSEGQAQCYPGHTRSPPIRPGAVLPIPAASSHVGVTYPVSAGSSRSSDGRAVPVYQDPTNGTGLLNPPTSWYWNIRIGDKIQLNNTGISATPSSGPMANICKPRAVRQRRVPGYRVPPVLNRSTGRQLLYPSSSSSWSTAWTTTTTATWTTAGTASTTMATGSSTKSSRREWANRNVEWVEIETWQALAAHST